MSETTPTTACEPPPQPPLPADLQVHPGDVLLHLVVTLLTPVFLGVCCGNPDFARMAALETINSYRARTQADLIAVGEIIAFGLAAISSASLSMAEDVSLAMALRLHADANACDRSAARNRRALENNQYNSPPQPVFAPAPDPEADRKDAEVIARVAATRKRAEALQATPPARPADLAPSVALTPAAVPAAAAAASAAPPASIAIVRSPAAHPAPAATLCRDPRLKGRPGIRPDRPAGPEPLGHRHGCRRRGICRRPRQTAAGRTRCRQGQRQDAEQGSR